MDHFGTGMLVRSQQSYASHDIGALCARRPPVSLLHLATHCGVRAHASAHVEKIGVVTKPTVIRATASRAFPLGSAPN